MADALHFEYAFLHCDAHLPAVYAGAGEIQPVMPPARAGRLQFGNEVRYETGGGLLRTENRRRHASMSLAVWFHTPSMMVTLERVAKSALNVMPPGR